MNIYRLNCEQEIPRPLEEAFAFFEDPRNLARITPPWLNFVIRTPDPEMRSGAVIDYTIRWLGLPMPWRTIIREYEPPYRFVDVQARGPYALWEHTHLFRPSPQGTLVTDEVRYALPLGPLGRLAHAIMVRRQLDGIFAYRRGALNRILGAGAPRDPVEASPDAIRPER
jgi:hypothetical protein